MAKAFALIRMDGGSPDLPWAQMDQEVFNFVLCDRILDSGWGAYLCSARGSVLSQLDDLWGGFIGIVAVTASGDIVWGELDELGDSTMRDKINTWLDDHGYRTIPDGWTNGEIVREIFTRANSHFDIRKIDIKEWDA